MAIKALIYLPHVSKACSRVREFTRAAAHDNLLCYNGRPLEFEEFNKLAPKVLLQGAFYGMQPIVKLVVVPDAVPAPATPEETTTTKPGATTPGTLSTPGAETPGAAAGASAPASPLPANLAIEPLSDGFVLVDLGGEGCLYRGLGGSWETDASLVQPFATETEALGVLAEICPPAGEAAKPKEPVKTAPKPADPAAKKAKAPAAATKPKAAAPAPSTPANA